MGTQQIRGGQRAAVGWTVHLDPNDATQRACVDGVERGFVPATRVGGRGFVAGVVAESVARWGTPPPGARIAICPHLRPAVDTDALFVGVLDEPVDAEALTAALLPALDAYRVVEAARGRSACLLVAVHFDDGWRGSLVVEAAQRALKSVALDQGLIPGEFGRHLCGLGSTFTTIETRRSDVGEYVAIRRLLRSDEKYMTIPAWRASFERWFRAHHEHHEPGEGPQ